METPTRAGGTVIAVLAVGLALSGCGSDEKTEPSKSSSSSSSASSSAPTTSAQASGPSETLADYIKNNNITETPIAGGDAGAPALNLPVPDGWEDGDATKPEGAYGQILFTGDPAMASNPPSIVAIMSKLSDNADPAQILQHAPVEVKNLPQFDGGGGEQDQLAGFQAVKIGGTYLKDGAKLLIAQKTVVIPSPNGLFVLQLNATGPENAADALTNAMGIIDDQTTITP